MRWGKYEPLESRDHSLDPFSNRFGELSADGQPLGLLSTRFETYWSKRVGRLWWKVWTGAHEVLVWEVTWLDGKRAYLYDDGVGLPDDTIVNELKGGTMTLYGDVFQVRWLTGDEFAKAAVVMGVHEDDLRAFRSTTE